jgi:uncharacterized membrane protein
MLFFLLVLITLIIFMGIDLIWLGVVGRPLYQKYLGTFLKKDVNWMAAIAFYLLFIIGIVYFVVAPAVENSSILEGFLRGGFFGLLMYATYDLTNLATLKDWPVEITLIDLVWGTLLGALTSGLSVLVGVWLLS